MKLIRINGFLENPGVLENVKLILSMDQVLIRKFQEGVLSH